MKDEQIIGIGTDIELVKRFEELPFTGNREFYGNIFADEEISECLAKPSASQSFAVRFAGKEAIIKGASAILKLSFKDILILNGGSMPKVVIKNERYRLRAHVSLSHTKEHALAFAIIIKEYSEGINGPKNEDCGCQHIHTA